VTAKKTGKTIEVSFEEGLKKLESIVEEMEGDNLPLEKLLECYEEGTRLAKGCQAKLEDAKLKIQKLQPNADDEDELIDDDSLEF